MDQQRDEEGRLRSTSLRNAESIFRARQRAEEELIRTKETLAKQSELLRLTLASIGDAVVTTDAQGKVLSVNATAAALTGWSEDEARGRDLAEMLRIVDESRREPRENPAARVLLEGRAAGFSGQAMLIARDGGETPIESSAAPIRDDQGRVHGVILIFRSTAERRRAEGALRRSERDLTDFFDNASVGLHWVGPDGTILRANSAELALLGYAEEEYVGRNIAEFHADADVIADIMRRLDRRECLQGYEARMRCRDGSIKDVLIDSSVHEIDGRFVHTRCFTRDDSARKRSERLLRLQKDTLELLVQGRPLTEVLDAVARAMETLAMRRCMAAVHLLDESGTRFDACVAPSLPAAYAEATRGMEIRTRVGPCCHAVLDRSTVVVPDVAADPSWRAFAAFALPLGIRAGWSTPVLSPQRTVSATFANYYREPGAPPAEDIAVMELLARTVALAIEHERAGKAKARLAAIVESSSDAIISKNLGGVITSWNAGAERIFGYAAAEAIGQPMTLLIPPDRHDEEALILEHIRRGESVMHYETVRRGRNGALLDMSVSVSPVQEGTGRIIGVSNVSRDITDRKRAERALRESEERYRRLVALLPVAIYTCEAPSGLITFYNPQAAALWGRAPRTGDSDERFCGSFRLWQRDGQPLAHAATPMARALRDGTSFRNEDVVIERPDGSRISVLVNIDPIRDAEGRIVGAINAFHDTTALKQAEEALRRWEHIFQQAGWAVAVAGAEDNVLRAVNPAFAAMHGYAVEELIGRPLALTFAPQSLPEFAKLAQIVHEKGDNVYEAVHIRKDGSQFPCLTHVTAFKDAGGKMLYRAATFQDLTRTKQAEQTARFLADASATLAELTDYRSTLQKVAALAVPSFSDWCAVDLQDPVGALERLALAHHEPNGLKLAEDLARRYPPRADDAHGVMKVMRSGTAELKAAVSDDFLVELARDEDHLRLLRALRPRSYICVPLRSRSKVIGAISFFTAASGRSFDANDLTAAGDLAARAVIAIENATLLATLKEADQRKDEFLAMLAHELRNPLAPIRNAVQIFRSTGVPVPELQWATEVIDRQVHQMTRLVDDLLDVSRITRGRVELRKEVVDLGAIVNSAVEASRPLIEKWQHELTVTIPPKPIRVEADPTRLAQVFLNLLNNAAKYTDRGGRIEIDASLNKSDEVVVRVRDNGIGIPREMLTRVFELFAQVDRSIARSEGGLGIGLTLVRQLVQMHGGAIEAASEGNGKGSEFIVRLPVARTDAAELPAREGAAAATPRARRILVVDDNRDAADSLAMLLRMIGNDVHTAHDGLEALGSAATFRPDVILLDIGLPKLNGYEVAARIRGQEGTRDALLIALTGWGQEEDRRRSQEAGFDHHVTKPVEFDALQKLLAPPPPNRELRSH